MLNVRAVRQVRVGRRRGRKEGERKERGGSVKRSKKGMGG